MSYWPFNVTTTRVVMLVGALMAFAVLVLSAYNLAFAQDNDDTIEYAENGTGTVAVFTAVDPEGGMVYWSLLTVLPNPVPVVDGEDLTVVDFEDHGDFSISMDGELTFNIPPDHEASADNGTNNEYKVVVVASDDAPGAGTPIMGYMKVVVEVTDDDELGMITLSSLQPQVDAVLTATHADPEVDTPMITWKWEKSQDMSSWTAVTIGVAAATYTPLETDEGYYLRVTATYDDSDDNERTAQAVSPAKVRAAPTTVDADAAFPEDAGEGSVDENSPAGTEVGDPVVANDTSDDVLTYSLTGVNEGNFEIDPATGQIMVGPRTVLDAEGTKEYMVTVTVTEAGGGTQTHDVTITVDNVNEAPMVIGGVTMKKHMEDDADSDDDDATAVATYTATDPDGGVNTLEWSVEGADKDQLEIGEGNGELTFKEAPNYEMPADAGMDNTYNVTVVATDPGIEDKNKMMAMRQVVIMVTNVEEDGTVTLSAQQPKARIALTASVTDPDSGVTDVEWKWYDAAIDVNDFAMDAIEGATSATYTPQDGNVGDTLSVRATYTDNFGKDSAMIATAHMVLARGDHEPVFGDDETGKREIDENSPADTDVGDPVGATDGDTTDILTFSLSGPDAASFTITSDADTTSRGGQIKVKEGTKLDREMKDAYMVTVTVADPGGLSDSIDVTITVTDVNEMPEVMGDAEEEYAENGTGTVAVFTAVDPEGGMVYWSLLAVLPVSVPVVDGEDLTVVDFEDHGDFSISMDGELTFNIPPDHEASADNGTNNEYKVVVVASDDAPGAGTPIMGYMKVVVEVTDDDELGMITLSSLQPQVDAVLTATHADPEVDTPMITWKWERSRSRSSWTAATIGVAAATYTPLETDEGYYLRVTATYDDSDDNERTAQAVSTSRVRTAPDSDAPAVFPNDAGERSVDENSPAETEVGDPVVANDTSDDVLTYSLTGVNEGNFEIDPATGQIMVGPRTVLDAEGTKEYMVTVTVTEAGGGTQTHDVTITVDNVNEAPMVIGGVTMKKHMEDDADSDDDDATAVATYTATDPDGGVNTLEWSVEGADKDQLEIGEGNGELTFKEAPNYEMPADAGMDNTYNVTVVATDPGIEDKNKMMAMRQVVIMVTNVEEDGTVTLSAQQPKARIALTASVTDPDSGVTDVEWKWYDAAIDVNDFAMDAIEGATSATYTPQDGNVGDTLSVRATYTDNFGKDSAMIATAHMVLARGDHEPVFGDDETGKREIDENSPADTDVGDPVGATDGDIDDILTYSLSGPDAASFTIDQEDSTAEPQTVGGQIKVKEGAKLDREMKDTYMVTVTAADPGGLMTSVEVTITVTDVNEAPTIMLGGLAISGPRSVPYEENGTDYVGMYTASGPNSDMATWSLSGDDMGDFMFSGGMLTFRSSPDYENPMDADMDNVYMVTIMADDGTYMDTHDVMVMVTNVDEPGRVTFWRDGQDATTCGR